MSGGKNLKSLYNDLETEFNKLKMQLISLIKFYILGLLIKR